MTQILIVMKIIKWEMRYYKKIYLPMVLLRCKFMEEVVFGKCASCNTVMTLFGHYMSNWLQTLPNILFQRRILKEGVRPTIVEVASHFSYLRFTQCCSLFWSQSRDKKIYCESHFLFSDVSHLGTSCCIQVRPVNSEIYKG